MKNAINSTLLFLDGDIPLATSYGVDIPQLIRFARGSRHATDFNTRNKYVQ